MKLSTIIAQTEQQLIELGHSVEDAKENAIPYFLASLDDVTRQWLRQTAKLELLRRQALKDRNNAP